MSRSGYSEDYDDDNYPIGLYRGTVLRASRGKRGQVLWRDLLAALDAMPLKELHAEVFDDPAEGHVCALGALARVKGIRTTHLDPQDDGAAEFLAKKLNVANCLARETIYMNDEFISDRHMSLRHSALHGETVASVGETPDQRWVRMRAWVAGQILEEKPT